MKEETFNRGQVVFKEGQDPVNKIYLVKRGEFELLKKLVLPKDQ